jgi:hypothetical protein
MFRMDSRVSRNNIQLSAMMAIVSPIFQPRAVFGRNQMSGRARGPTLQTAKIINGFWKYHLMLFSLGSVRWDTSRNSPQCLHFIASSWISSAQKGHFFIRYSSSIKGAHVAPSTGIKPRPTFVGAPATPSRPLCGLKGCVLCFPSLLHRWKPQPMKPHGIVSLRVYLLVGQSDLVTLTGQPPTQSPFEPDDIKNHENGRDR